MHSLFQRDPQSTFAVHLRSRIWKSLLAGVFAISAGLMIWGIPEAAHGWEEAGDDDEAEQSEESSETTATAGSDDDDDDEDAPVSRKSKRSRRKMKRRESSGGATSVFGDTGSRADPVDSFGMQGSLGHVVGKTVGRDTSITPLELFPFMMMDQRMLFSDIRLFETNRSRFGGNLGFGYRQYAPTLERVFGISGWYDGDDSTKAYVQQVGLSLESYGEYFDVRSNFYLPVGQTTRNYGNTVVPGSLMYSGNSILYDQSKFVVNAMRGLDMEAGVPIGTSFGERHNLRTYAGWYHFQGDDVPSFTGWKGRIEANVVPEVPIYLQVTSDKVYHTNVIFGISFAYSGKLYDQRSSRKTPYGRIGEYVKRNYNVIAPRQNVVEHGLVAINPATNRPYVIEHVDTAAAGTQTGTAADPFTTIAQAQAAGGDLVLVHAGSVFTGANSSITLNPGERILGDSAGIRQLFNLSGFGNIYLPHANSGTDRPILQSAAGDAVTLASNSEFSGFVITNPTGNGIVANGVTGTTVQHVDVINAGGDGIQVQNATGTLLFANNNLMNAGGAAFHVLGGSAVLNVSDQISNNNGQTVSVENTTGGAVNFMGSTITDNGGKGILLNNDAGSVLIDNATLTDTTTAGISILGGSGVFTFLDTTTITNPTGAGVNINGLTSTGVVNFEYLTINGRNNAGISMNNIAGQVFFLADTTLGTHNSGTGAGIELLNSTGAITFNTISMADSGGAGIHIGENLTGGSGSFVALGATSINSAAGPGVSVTNNNTQIQFNGFTDTNRGGNAVSIDNTHASVAFLGTNTINNELGSAASAIKIQNSPGNIGFATSNITNTTGAAGVNLANNLGTTTFDTLNISTTGGAGLQALNSGNLVVTTGGTINAVGGSAVDLQGTNLTTNFTSLSSNGAVNGIRLVDTTGQFVVSGDGTNLASGGTIQNATTGVLLNNARNVGLGFMDISGNGVGLSATNTNRVQLESVRIVNSTTYGIDSRNTGNLQVNDSLLSNNGAAGFNSIRAQVDTVGVYSLSLTQSNIVGGAADNVAISTVTGGEGSQLGLSILNNNITNAQNGTSGVNLAWNGLVSGTFTGNTLGMTGGLNTGLNLNTLSTTDLANFRITGNTVTLNGASDTGITLNTAGPSTAVISQNLITFGSASATGMNFSLANTSNITLGTNEIDATAGGSTGVLFSSISNPAIVSISNNLMNLSGNSSLNDRGIIFQNVTGQFNLQGAQNNVIRGAVTPFSSPIGTALGQILVNGAFAPTQ